ncbi:helix-turn-helix transcriptional regulator [Acidithiobacillus thiooxidans]|uniref:helix-turn-helix transcriptional regulator n=1 Tax=Acidithiobacillus thiooxidans TaxID=930 RepID=UPI002866745F|nr:helix-turn-helix transcriptional regulator [Acidithiobacillus thiooxidans]MDR7927614.1 helix-turn-helix transcriptional regulator [Acidithiobacillus thiooxidans]
MSNKKLQRTEPAHGPSRRAESSLRSLAERLKRARKRRGWSQIEMARLLQVSIVTYRKMEKADPGTAIGTWVAVLSLLGMLGDLDNLLLYDRDYQGAALEQSLRTRRRSRSVSPDDLADSL